MNLAIREADGVKIRFAEAGQGGERNGDLDRALAGEPARLPKSMGPPRRTEFHLVAIDLPGFGQSERQLDLLSPPAMGAFLVRCVREWSLGPVHLVAPDVGTSAALWAASNDPALVRSLVIGGGGMAVPLAGGWFAEGHHRGTQHGRLPPDRFEGHSRSRLRRHAGRLLRRRKSERTTWSHMRATGSWNPHATFAPIPPNCRSWPSSCPALRRPVQIVCGHGTTPWSRHLTKSSSTPGCLTAGWTSCPQGISHGEDLPDLLWGNTDQLDGLGISRRRVGLT